LAASPPLFHADGPAARLPPPCCPPSSPRSRSTT